MRLKARIRFYAIIFISISICITYLVYSTDNGRIKESYSEKRVVHFHCRFHYGDNIANLKFFYDIAAKLKENNVMVYYYYDNNQNKNEIEFTRYIDRDTLTLRLLSERPENSVELWMGMDIDGVSHGDFDVYFPKFYTRILMAMNMQGQGIDVSLYQKEDYLLDVYERLDAKYKDLDILVLNSQPYSGQFASYNPDTMNAMCRKLATKYKIATSTHVDDSIPCTMRDGLAIQDIGAISTHAKYVVGVFSGPLTACFNQYSKEHVKKWIFFLSNPLKLIEIDNILLDNVEGVYNIIEEEDKK